MKITGTSTLAAPPQQVWDAVHDPAVLARCLPGCERLTELAHDHYAMTVTAGVAAIKGTYDGEVACSSRCHRARSPCGPRESAPRARSTRSSSCASPRRPAAAPS